jgi:single-stranded-DNA-specific exonuclease
MPRIVRREAAPQALAWDWPENMHPVLRQVLARRPLRSPEDMQMELRRLIPVGEFTELDAAVELLIRHRQGRIVIVGDFDADGATSTALLVLTLRALGFSDVHYFIPDRFTLGYGLSAPLVERVRELEPALIVTVDNGISSLDGVSAARAAGIDVLVTDHHLPGEQLPAANAIVNPNVPGSGFPGKHLAGVGVAFYLAAALGRALGQPAAAATFLDLVALGTVADLVVLDHCNRILVAQGLSRIRAGRCRPGIRALYSAAGLNPRDAGSSSLGYQIAPRLNAAGRLEDMSLGVRLLLTESDMEAVALAARLDTLNRERREIESRMRAEAVALVDNNLPAAEDAATGVLVIHRDDWHEGLVGLVASRIREKHHRPVVAFAPASSGTLKGSGRSIPGFHLRDALADVAAAHPSLIERFGGHAMAAGLTLRADALDEFRAAMESVAAARLTQDMLAQTVLTDGEIAPEHHTIEVAALLRDAAPWGQGFPEPQFDGRFELLEQRRLKDAHLKMKVRAVDGGRRLDAIAFNHPDAGYVPGMTLRLVYRLSINDYYSPADVQLMVEHVEREAHAEPARQGAAGD